MYDGSVFKGPRLEREKEGFVGADLAAWQPDGKPLFFLSGQSGFMALLDFHFGESRLWGWFQAHLVVLGFGILRDRDPCAWLTDPLPAISSPLCPACTTKAVCPLQLNLRDSLDQRWAS